MSALRDP